jgi:hypothetical protein
VGSELAYLRKYTRALQAFHSATLVVDGGPATRRRAATFSDLEIPKFYQHLSKSEGCGVSYSSLPKFQPKSTTRSATTTINGPTPRSMLKNKEKLNFLNNPHLQKSTTSDARLLAADTFPSTVLLPGAVNLKFRVL